MAITALHIDFTVVVVLEAVLKTPGLVVSLNLSETLELPNSRKIKEYL
jgi:hypothetical protein